MIKIGEHKDVEQGVQLIKEYIKEFDFGKFDEDNTEYYTQLMTAIAADKTSVVSIDEDGTINGVLLGYRIGNILNPSKQQFHVLVTWVRKDLRGSSIFYRMNKMLEKEVLKKNEEVILYGLPNTNLNYDKLGYKILQTMYIKENI